MDIDEQARERFERIIEQMKQVEQVTEELKAKDLACMGTGNEQHL